MNKSNTQLYFYRGKQLATSRKAAESISLLSGRCMPLAEVDLKGSAVAANLYGVDSLSTIQSERRGSSISYTAFGFLHGAAPPSSLLGFTGQHCQLNGLYLLGGGHRAYSPMLMRFCSADGLSPFGKGGINAYVYCENDPVNYSDPSGRAKLWRSFKKQLTRLTGLSSKVKTYDKGKADGHANGLAKGFSEGHTKGLTEGHAQGLTEGHAEGVREGRILGHQEGFEGATNGEIQWDKWMMDPAYADQTVQQAVDNAYRGEKPYLVAKLYGTSANDRLTEIYSLARGVPLIRGITMEGSLSYFLKNNWPGGIQDPRRQ
ncbi:RHS repeat-associated core domain-containing protein [Pseudomonas rustica]